MKQIPLTQGQFAKVDDWWYDYLMQWKWHAEFDKNTKSYYAARLDSSRKKIYMAREIMNTPKEMICDHINHETLNNQEHNLRNVTNSQSSMNRRLRSDNILREKCVTKNGSGFLVRVVVEGKRVFCKTYRTIGEARKERDKAIKKHHGEFCNL